MGLAAQIQLFLVLQLHWKHELVLLGRVDWEKAGIDIVRNHLLIVDIRIEWISELVLYDCRWILNHWWRQGQGIHVDLVLVEFIHLRVWSNYLVHLLDWRAPSTVLCTLFCTVMWSSNSTLLVLVLVLRIHILIYIF